MAKPKLALIPATQGSKLYSVLPADGVGDFTFSRNSAATRINKDGLIETVASGVSRLNYPLIDGVVNGCPSHLLEPSRLQKIQYSEDFSQGYWIKQASTINSNNAISPDGTLNADLYTTSSATFDFIQTTSSFIVSGYSFSVFAKKGTSDKIDLALSGTAFTDARSVRFDLTNKTTETLGGILSSKIEEYPNGWMRCSVYAVTNTSGSGTIRILSGSSNNVSTLYLYGAQLEQGSYPTSYIPNYGTSAGITRSAETATGAGDASTFNDSEGVLMAELSIDANDGNFRFLSISDGTNSNAVWVYYRSDANQINFRVIVGGVSSFDDIYTINNATENTKLLLKYKENDFSAWVNGFEVLTDNSGITFSSNVLNELEFNRPDGINNFYGNTKQIQYFDSALTDSDLETLTSWTSFTDLANGQQYSIK